MHITETSTLPDAYRDKSLFRGATVQFPGGGGGGLSFFEINNFGRTLRVINNLLQELFYIIM